MVKVSNSLPFQFRFFPSILFPFFAIVFVFSMTISLVIVVIDAVVCFLLLLVGTGDRKSESIERIGGDIDIDINSGVRGRF